SPRTIEPTPEGDCTQLNELWWNSCFTDGRILYSSAFRTSADSYCRIDLAADASCVVDICRTVCEDEDRGPTYRDLMRDVSGFNYDDSVTNTTKDFGGGNVTVAVFNMKAQLAFMRG
ncbi:hypothetical protein LSAT2_010898, partial [Lamellibrachia satsuma]